MPTEYAVLRPLAHLHSWRMGTDPTNVVKRISVDRKAISSTDGNQCSDWFAAASARCALPSRASGLDAAPVSSAKLSETSCEVWFTRRGTAGNGHEPAFCIIDTVGAHD